MGQPLKSCDFKFISDFKQQSTPFHFYHKCYLRWWEPHKCLCSNDQNEGIYYCDNINQDAGNYMYALSFLPLVLVKIITVVCWGVFKGPYHSTCKVLNFWLPTVGCWITEEFVCYNRLLIFHKIREIWILFSIICTRS